MRKNNLKWNSISNWHKLYYSGKKITYKIFTIKIAQSKWVEVANRKCVMKTTFFYSWRNYAHANWTEKSILNYTEKRITLNDTWMNDEGAILFLGINSCMQCGIMWHNAALCAARFVANKEKNYQFAVFFNVSLRHIDLHNGTLQTCTILNKNG